MQGENKEKQTTVTPPKISKGGYMTFKRSPNSGETLDLVTNITVPASHTNGNIIVVESKTTSQIHILQIREEGIVLASKHTINIPIDGIFKRKINNSVIIYQFPKDLVEKTKKSLKFFEEKKIDWKTPSHLVFSFKYGIDRPEVIEPDYLGEQKNELSGYKEIELGNIFDRHKPLLGCTHCFFTRKSKGLFVKEREVLAAEFGSKKPNLVRGIFKFNVDYQKTKAYKDKIKADQSKVDEYHLPHLLFDEEKFVMENGDQDQNLKFKTFFRITPKMVILGLYDLRLKKVTAKAFVSVYELFEGLESMKITESLNMSITKAEYSPNLDIMALEISMKRIIPSYLAPKLLPLLESEIKAGRYDRFGLSWIIERREMDNYFQIKQLRFVVHNCFYRSGAKRRVEIYTMGYKTNSHIRLSRGAMVTHEEDSELFIFRIRQHRPPRTAQTPTIEQEGEAVALDSQEPQEKQSQGSKNLTEYESGLPLSILKELFGEDDHCIRTVALIQESVLLIAGQTKMLLLDFIEFKILSYFSFTNGVSLDVSAMKHSHDLVATTNMALGVVNFHQIIPLAGGGASLEYIGRSDLRIVQNLHSAIRLLHFDKINDETYQMALQVEWMTSKEITITSPYILTAKIKVERSEEGKLRFVERPEMKVLRMFHGTNYDTVSSYMKEKSWYQIYTFKAENFATVMKRHPDSEIFLKAMFSPADPEGGEKRKILSCHAGKKYDYYVLGGYLNRPFALDPGVEVQAIDYKEKNAENGFMVNPEIKKSVKFGRSADIRFDEVSDDFRMFKFDVIFGGVALRLEVYDSELEKTAEYEIEGIQSITQFKVIDEDRLFLQGVYADSEGGKYTKKEIDLLVDLKNNKSTEFVDEGGERLRGVPLVTPEGKLITFTRSENGLKYNSFEGIFVCEEEE